MANLDAAAVAQKWARGMQGATKSMTDGANAVTEAPGAKAAAAQDRYLSGVQDAVSSGKFANNSRAVTLEQWRQAYLTKGVPRVSAGVTAALPVFQDFIAQAAPIYTASSRQVQAMPKGTEQDSIDRMVANMRNMKTIKFVRRR